MKRLVHHITGGELGLADLGFCARARVGEGQWNCSSSGKSFQRCASGVWSAAIPVAPGTSCQPGTRDSLVIVNKRGSSDFVRRGRFIPGRFQQGRATTPHYLHERHVARQITSVQTEPCPRQAGFCETMDIMAFVCIVNWAL